MNILLSILILSLTCRLPFHRFFASHIPPFFFSNKSLEFIYVLKKTLKDHLYSHIIIKFHLHPLSFVKRKKASLSGDDQKCHRVTP